MSWRQGQRYSQELRDRVLATVDGGTGVCEAARTFQVSVSCICKALLRDAKERSIDALLRRIGTLLDQFHPAECAAYFQHTGYQHSM